MFLIDCPTHGSQVLLPASHVRGLRNTDHGIDVLVECWCGTRAVLHTGRRVTVADPAALAPAD